MPENDKQEKMKLAVRGVQLHQSFPFPRQTFKSLQAFFDQLYVTSVKQSLNGSDPLSRDTCTMCCSMLLLRRFAQCKHALPQAHHFHSHWTAGAYKMKHSTCLCCQQLKRKAILNSFPIFRNV